MVSIGPYGMPEQRPYNGAVFIYDSGTVTTYCPAVLAVPELPDAYIRACFERMRVEPDHFGFHSESKYVEFLQAWDRALFDIQCVAYGRIRHMMPNVYLIPDGYFIARDGYRYVREFALSADLPAWPQRSSVLTWRGSVTGSGTFAAIGNIPRVKLASVCRAIPGTDVRLVGAHPSMLHQSIFPLEQINDFLAVNGIVGEWFDMRKFSNYKFVIDIDGHANAWGFFEKLLLGSWILKVESPFEEWFYDSIRPWVHYAPVSDDLSDLPGKLDWCLGNDAECESIARNGFKLAHSITAEQVLRDTCGQLI
jgi:Glycosyl transferase family 90